MKTDGGPPASVTIRMPGFVLPLIPRAGQSAPGSPGSAPDAIPLEPSVGPDLMRLHEARAFLAMEQIAEGGDVNRVAFFHADPTQDSIAQFATHFTAETFRHYRTWPINAYLAPEATVLGHSSVVLVAGQVVPETLSHVMTWREGSEIESASREGQVRLRHAMEVTRRVRASEAVVGFTASWTNYAHWMQECMPKVMAYRVLAQTRPWLKLVLPRLAPGSFQAASVALLGIDQASIVSLEVGQAVSFTRCWLISGTDIWQIHPFLRRISERLVAQVSRPAATERRIYVRRDGPLRRVANFAALQPLLDCARFSVVAFDGMSLEEQISVMQGADMVIAEHGAGLANIQFCRPGTAVLELFNESCVQPAFWSLASCFDLRFGFMIGRSERTAERPEPDWNSSYTVDPAALQTALTSMGAGVGPV